MRSHDHSGWLVNCIPWHCRCTTHQCNVTDVVPDISTVLIGDQVQGSLQTVQSHVKLLGIVAAETQVSEELCIVHPHLEQTSGKEGGREGGRKGEEDEGERGTSPKCYSITHYEGACTHSSLVENAYL